MTSTQRNGQLKATIRRTLCIDGPKTFDDLGELIAAADDVRLANSIRDLTALQEIEPIQYFGRDCYKISDTGLRAMCA